MWYLLSTKPFLQKKKEKTMQIKNNKKHVYSFWTLKTNNFCLDCLYYNELLFVHGEKKNCEENVIAFTLILIYL